MKNHIPAGNNPAIAGLLLSPRMQYLMFSAAGRAQDLYQQIVAKRTGALAASAQIGTFVGGKRNDRWCARLTVGPGIQHGAPHEFGYDDGDTHIATGAHDLNQVLNMMSGR